MVSTTSSDDGDQRDRNARRLDARKLLYATDADGNPTFEKTPIYIRYQENKTALAHARSQYAAAYAEAMADRAKAQNWPIESGTYQRAIDQARDDLIAEGADEVEHALAVLGEKSGI